MSANGLTKKAAHDNVILILNDDYSPFTRWDELDWVDDEPPSMTVFNPLE